MLRFVIKDDHFSQKSERKQKEMKDFDVNNAAFIDIKVLIIFVDSWGLKENPPCSDWN